MEYISVKETANKWNISERSVRNYCKQGRIPGAFLDGKTWQIPLGAKKPARKNKKAPKNLLEILKDEKKYKASGGIYHKLQIEFTYNSNHIEGSHLSHEQTRYIFETNTIGTDDGPVNVDDVLETANHFKCIDMVIDKANNDLTESFIRDLHRTLKNGTSDSRKSWFAVGNYKKLPNEVGGKETTRPEDVSEEIKKLVEEYNKIENVSFEDIIKFHVKFEKIHPFQDGNGRVGRLIMLKETLKQNIVPIIIDEELKYFYYRGLDKWEVEKGFLIGTCQRGQDKFKAYLDYFEIKY